MNRYIKVYKYSLKDRFISWTKNILISTVLLTRLMFYELILYIENWFNYKMC